MPEMRITVTGEQSKLESMADIVKSYAGHFALGLENVNVEFIEEFPEDQYVLASEVADFIDSQDDVKLTAGLGTRITSALLRQSSYYDVNELTKIEDLIIWKDQKPHLHMALLDPNLLERADFRGIGNKGKVMLARFLESKEANQPTPEQTA